MQTGVIVIGAGPAGLATSRELSRVGYFVGHNYDARGGLRNIGHDARIAATLIARGM
jgi:NADPH-dependent glutamate synthase beta subunit-like oxidoreductase